MDPKDFDDILKDKLENLESSSSPMPDWDRMERELDSHKDQVFDEQVKRKLEQLTVNQFAPADWSTLYELISTRLRRKKSILISKSVELSILFLLFFSFSQMGWFDEYEDDVFYADSFVKPTQSEKETHLKTQVSESNLNSNQDETFIETSENNKSISIDRNTKFVAQVIDVRENNNEQLLTEEKANPQNFNPTFNSEGLIPLQDEAMSSILNVQAITSTTKKIENLDVDDSVLKNQYAMSFKQDLVTPVLNLKVNDQDKKASVVFFTDAGVDLAVANIESSLRNDASRNVNSSDKSTNKLYPVINLNAGAKFNKATVSTGIEYQSISYDPAVSHVAGELSSILRETEIETLNYDVLSIPLTFSWNIFSRKKWDVRVNTGLVSNIILNVDVTANQTLTSGNRITVVDEKNIDYSGFPLAINKGVFDDNTFIADQNAVSPYYFQSRTGFQVERRINQKTSVISNVNYNYQLPTLDTEKQDNISSFSLGLAVRKYFG